MQREVLKQYTHDLRNRYQYLVNLNNPNQVLTIGRRIEDGKMYVATCINRLPFDEFDKRLARHIVTERLNKDDTRFAMDVPPKGQKEVSVARAIANGVFYTPRKVRQVAKQYLKLLEVASPPPEQIAEHGVAQA